MAWDKTQMRIEKAARLELTGLFTDAEIAETIGLTPAGYAQMKTRADYIDTRAAIKVGYIRDLDANLGDDIKALRQKIKDNLPAAVQTIIDAAQQRRDLRIAVSAAETLIEIEGNLVQPKKIEIDVPTAAGDQPEDTIVDAISIALAKKLQKDAKSGSQTVN